MRIDLGLFGRRLAIAAIVSAGLAAADGAAAKDEEIDVIIDTSRR